MASTKEHFVALSGQASIEKLAKREIQHLSGEPVPLLSGAPNECHF